MALLNLRLEMCKTVKIKGEAYPSEHIDYKKDISINTIKTIILVNHLKGIFNSVFYTVGASATLKVF